MIDSGLSFAVAIRLEVIARQFEFAHDFAKRCFAESGVEYHDGLVHSLPENPSGAVLAAWVQTLRQAITALTRREAQQEAPGAAAYARCKHDRWADQCLRCNPQATPPAPVDVRVPMGRFVELLAQLVNAPQTDDEFDADVLRREVVMEKVTQLRVVWDDLSKAHRALLDGQPAGVECKWVGAMRGDGKCPQCSQYHALGGGGGRS